MRIVSPSAIQCQHDSPEDLAEQSIKNLDAQRTGNTHELAPKSNKKASMPEIKSNAASLGE